MSDISNILTLASTITKILVDCTKIFAPDSIFNRRILSQDDVTEIEPTAMLEQFLETQRKSLEADLATLTDLNDKRDRYTAIEIDEVSEKVKNRIKFKVNELTPHAELFPELEEFKKYFN